MGYVMDICEIDLVKKIVCYWKCILIFIVFLEGNELKDLEVKWLRGEFVEVVWGWICSGENFLDIFFIWWF